MRPILFLLLVLPFVTHAQINRSARELASERVAEYVSSKLFKDQPYKSVSFGQIKEVHEKDVEITWSIVHEFEIKEPTFNTQQPEKVKTCRFIFFLDKRMHVKRAETWSLD